MNAMMKLVIDNGQRPVDDERRGMLAKVHIARKALAILDADYRALMERLTGHRSAKDCDDRQLATLIAEFERMGWRTSGGKTRRAVGGSQTVRKARAMWIRARPPKLCKKLTRKIHVTWCRSAGLTV